MDPLKDDLGPYAEIQIRDGVAVKVDPPLENFVRGLRLGVRLSDSTKWLYAYHQIRGFGEEVGLHRLLIGAANGELVDHVNGNTLDNRLRNLRICTNAENIRNSQRRAAHGSRFKGVSRVGKSNKWRAQIMHQYKKYNLGCFADEVEAAHCYDGAARKLFGEFARCNFPVGGSR